jgi:uncharacterized protein (DUF433 family)
MIGQWKHHGYIRASRRSRGYPLVYSYQDVGEAMLVHELVDRGIEYDAIRSAIRELRHDYGSWPLTAAKESLRVPAVHYARAKRSRTIVLHLDDRVTDIGTAAHGVDVLTDADLVSIAVDLERGGWAARRLPNLRHIEVNPNRLSGRPVVRGTRVAALEAGRLAETSDGKEVLRVDYSLSKVEIEDARRWWHEVRTYEAQAA